MTKRYSYLYGVIAADEPVSFGRIGIKDTPVHTVCRDGLAAITGPVEQMVFAELPAREVLECLAQHQRVLEHVMADATLVPLKFGTVAVDDEQIARILAAGRGEFVDVLNRCAGKIELDIAASWADLQTVLAEIATDDEVVAMKAQIASESSQSLQQRVRLGQLVKTLLDERRSRLAAELAEALRAEHPEMLVNATRDDTSVLNAAVLVDRSRSFQLEQTLEQLNQCHEGRLNFRLVGPLPPYSFATAEVQPVDAGELDAARKTLELPESASMLDIKAAYRRLLRKHHPDRNQDPASAEQLKRVSSACELLEQYALNFKHAFTETHSAGAVIVKVRTPAEASMAPAVQAA